MPVISHEVPIRLLQAFAAKRGTFLALVCSRRPQFSEFEGMVVWFDRLASVGFGWLRFRRLMIHHGAPWAMGLEAQSAIRKLPLMSCGRWGSIACWLSWRHWECLSQ